MSDPRGRPERRLWGPNVRKDVEDELAYHLELRQEEYAARGLNGDEARAEAERRFGDVEAIARSCREIDKRWHRERKRASMWTDLIQDVGYALRLLRRSPVFTVIAVVTLALGIGATSAIFSVANWALLRPLAGVSNPEDVRVVWSGTRRTAGSFSPGRVSYPNYLDVLPRLQTIAVGAYQRQSAIVSTGGGEARTLAVQYITASYFPVLGARIGPGRPFSEREDAPGAPEPVAVISEGLWTSMFNRSTDVFKQPISVNGRAITVVGVAAGGFRGTDRMSLTDIWLPGALYPVINYFPQLYDNRGSGGYYEFIARLKDGATWPQAEAELRSLSAWLASAFPEENAKFKTVGFHLFGPIGTPPLGGNQVAAMMMLMLGASALVLLIACANVASLLLIRGIGRGGEVAVRKALGAARFRLLRQHLTEGVLLWSAGGAAGLFLVWLLMQSVDGSMLLGLGGPIGALPIDWRVVAFTAALSFIVGLVFSLTPAFHAVRAEPAVMLRSAAPTASRGRAGVGSTLTVVQLSASLTLLVAALLLAGTVRHLVHVPLGFEPDNVWLFHVDPGSLGYTPARALEYNREFARRLSLRPGVERVAVAERAHFTDPTMTTSLKVDGQPKRPYLALSVGVMTPGYFETLKIPLVRGRLFSDDDMAPPGGASRPVVILSELAATQMFGTVDAVGRSIAFNVMGRANKQYDVIGVVGDSRFGSLTDEIGPMVYEPAGLAGALRTDATVVFRTSRSADAAVLAGDVRAIGAALNNALPVGRLVTMADSLARARAQWDVLARLMFVLAGLAGLLAAVGLYGVVAFGVESRRREFGIRIALGATPRGVVRLVLRRTGTITVAGLIIGSAGAIVLGQVLESRLVGVRPFDPIVWLLACAGLVAIAVAASFVPVRRAMRVDVTETLRAL